MATGRFTMMTYTKTIECTAPLVVFTEQNYEDIPEAYRYVIDAQNGLPCDGGGVPGNWCRRCFWGAIYNEESF